jgi:predicted CoA-substrate-specific enzyme activase
VKTTRLLGIDIGSTTAKAAVLDEGGRLLGWRLLPTGHDGRAVARQLREELLGRLGIRDAPPAVATGYSRALVDWAGKTVTEITCHARGVRHLHPDARTILDIGGQDSKAIRLDARGLVEDFAMNDRCAAGTGSFLDVIANKFGRSLEDLSNLHAREALPIEISSTCVVFAETEVVGLLSQGRALDDVLAGVQRAVARRAAAMVRQVRPVEPIYFSGGVALNESVRREISAVLGTELRRSEHPQLTAAIGAALLAKEGAA